MPRQRTIQPGGTRGTVFREIARIRLQDASVLLGHHRLRGAVYLAGYSIECILKWAVTSHRDLVYLPADLENHDWNCLLVESGLSAALRQDKSAAAIFSELADIWGPELRYLAKEPLTREAAALYERFVILYDWINEHAV